LTAVLLFSIFKLWRILFVGGKIFNSKISEKLENLHSNLTYKILVIRGIHPSTGEDEF
jgi:hypothetical protein